MFKKDDDGIIDLRSKGKKAHDDDEPEFEIRHVDEEPDFLSEEPEEKVVVRRPGHEDMPPAPYLRPEPPKPVVHGEEHKMVEKVKIKFEKFLTLVVKADNEDFFQEHANEDVMLDASFLADLASMGEGKKDKKWFLIFIGGIIIGLVIAYFLFKQ